MPNDNLAAAAQPLPPDDELAGAFAPGARWYVLWTRSNCEQQVHDQLATRGLQPFLPKISRWSRRADLRYLARVPMFPGYLFLRHAMTQSGFLEVCRTKGLVRLLGESWDRLATVADREIEAIQRVLDADVPVLPHAYLREGQRVRVHSGPLAPAEGILLQTERETGQLVLSVELLRRSVVVEIDCTLVTPL